MTQKRMGEFSFKMNTGIKSKGAMGLTEFSRKWRGPCSFPGCVGETAAAQRRPFSPCRWSGRCPRSWERSNLCCSRSCRFLGVSVTEGYHHPSARNTHTIQRVKQE